MAKENSGEFNIRLDLAYDICYNIGTVETYEGYTQAIPENKVAGLGDNLTQIRTDINEERQRIAKMDPGVERQQAEEELQEQENTLNRITSLYLLSG